MVYIMINGKIVDKADISEHTSMRESFRRAMKMIRSRIDGKGVVRRSIYVPGRVINFVVYMYQEC